MRIRNRFIPLVLSLFLAFIWATTAVAKPDAAEAKRADIRKLMELTGAGTMGKQVADQMLLTLSQTMPDVPAEVWKSFGDALNAQELVDMVVPIYEKHFSHDDIKAIIAFYQSPAGKRMIRAMPAITQESMIEGQRWGEKAMQRIMTELQSKGLLQ